MCLTASADVSPLVRLMCLTCPMREKSVTEQRYDAVLGVISQGRTVMEVAGQLGVSRRTLYPPPPIRLT